MRRLFYEKVCQRRSLLRMSGAVVHRPAQGRICGASCGLRNNAWMLEHVTFGRVGEQSTAREAALLGAAARMARSTDRYGMA